MNLADLFFDPQLLRYAFVAALLTFVAVLVVIPFMVIRLPAGYFQGEWRGGTDWSKHHPLIRLPLLVLKNLLAVVCVLAGIVMLVLPGQGVLTILVGLLLMDFPGKFRVERWLVSKAWVARTLNRIRELADKPPFEL